MAGPPRGRLGLSILLGTAAVVFGIGLMASAGYLIARAAERPAILSLTTAIVAVRFFGLARPLVRYLERLASHDLAFRLLARVRGRFYERIEPLAPAGLQEYRRGDLVSRMVGDVDALQSLYLRGLGPPVVALCAGALAIGVAAAILPAAALVLAIGLAVGAVGIPAVAGLVGRVSGRGRATAQGHLAAEVVELLRGAPELVVYGRDEEALRRFREADAALARLGPARLTRGRACGRARTPRHGCDDRGCAVRGRLGQCHRRPRSRVRRGPRASSPRFVRGRCTASTRGPRAVIDGRGRQARARAHRARACSRGPARPSPRSAGHTVDCIRECDRALRAGKACGARRLQSGARAWPRRSR